MRKVLTFVQKGPMQVTGAALAAALLTVGLVQAATTISTDITTAGNVYASTTVQGVNIIDWGNTTLSGTLAVTGASAFTAKATFAGGAYASTTLQGAAITDYGALTVVTSDSATSTTSVGCIQLTATSTNTPIKLRFFATTTALNNTSISPVGGGTAGGFVLFAYGNCP